MRDFRASTLLLTCAAALAVAGCNSIRFDSAYCLYAGDETAYRLGDGVHVEDDTVDFAFDRALEQDRPVILFIHGRGKEPGKSLHGMGWPASHWVEGRAVPKLEEYQAHVLLFSWDAAHGGPAVLGRRDRTRPLSKMSEAARRLRETLAALRRSFERHKDRARPPVVLLGHSMGAIVLQTYVEELRPAERPWPGRTGGGPLFDRVLLTGADADDVGHEEWLEPMAKVEDVYVAVNPGDWILSQSFDDRRMGAEPLGAHPGDRLAPSATYVEIACGADDGDEIETHEVFNRAVGRKYKWMAPFFEQVLRGDRPSLREGVDVRRVPGFQNRYCLLRKN